MEVDSVEIYLPQIKKINKYIIFYKLDIASTYMK